MSKVYSICVTEASKVYYSVEADSPEEAEQIFSDWADNHIDDICYDLNKGFEGWDFSDPDEEPEGTIPDITKDDIKEE